MDANLAKLARQLNRRNGCRNPITPRNLFPSIVLMTDTARLQDPVPVLADIPSGSLVIFRHYDHPDRNRIAFQTRQACRRYHHYFSVANDVGLAQRLNADGIHLQDKPLDPRIRIILRKKVNRWIITAAAHHRRSANRWLGLNGLSPIVGEKIAGLVISPVFATATHPDAAPIEHRIRCEIPQLALAKNCTAIALGGINDQNARTLRFSRFGSLAGISFVQ